MEKIKHHDSFKKNTALFLGDSVAAKTGGGSQIPMDFCRSIFAFFRSTWQYSSATDVGAVTQKWSPAGRSRKFTGGFLDGKWSIREAIKMGSFLTNFLTPKFQKVIKMAVPNGVIGTKYILRRNYIGYFFPIRKGYSFPCHIWSCQRLVLWPEKVWLGLLGIRLQYK